MISEFETWNIWIFTTNSDRIFPITIEITSFLSYFFSFLLNTALALNKNAVPFVIYREKNFNYFWMKTKQIQLMYLVSSYRDLLIFMNWTYLFVSIQCLTLLPIKKLSVRVIFIVSDDMIYVWTWNLLNCLFETSWKYNNFFYVIALIIPIALCTTKIKFLEKV